MKIQGDDFSMLKTALLDTLKAHNLHPFMVKSESDAWDVFFKAWNEKRFDGNALYKKYNDAHISTAFKAIFK